MLAVATAVVQTTENAARNIDAQIYAAVCVIYAARCYGVDFRLDSV